jgi:hypothetical protein
LVFGLWSLVFGRWSLVLSSSLKLSVSPFFRFSF